MSQILYYLYHIPGQKIGVTRNLNRRLTVQQGYQPSEYEVLEISLDIDYISKREAELQLLYGYKIDRDTYKDLMSNLKKQKQMKLNVTEQTITFPCPVNKLKGQLMDLIGLNFETQYGKYILDQDMADWIVKNAATSMFNSGRSYVYNKALDTWANTISADQARNIEVKKPVDIKGYINEAVRQSIMDINKSRETQKETNIYGLIRSWARDKGIYSSGDSKTQYVKLMEEAGELAQAILKKDKPEIKDAVGDMIVVLTNLAHLEGLEVEDCITSAYDVIKNRTGKMQNGTFVKQTL